MIPDATVLDAIVDEMWSRLNESLIRGDELRQCPGGGGGSENSLLPLAKALYEEGRALAASPKDKKIVENLLFSLEIIELRYEAAERRDIERSPEGTKSDQA